MESAAHALQERILAGLGGGRGGAVFTSSVHPKWMEHRSLPMEDCSWSLLVR